jgi:hypothetical protein
MVACSLACLLAFHLVSISASASAAVQPRLKANSNQPQFRATLTLYTSHASPMRCTVRWPSSIFLNDIRQRLFFYVHRHTLCLFASGPPCALSSRIRIASVPSSTKLSLNQGCFRACLAVILFAGSYTKIFLRRSRSCLLNAVFEGMNSWIRC